MFIKLLIIFSVIILTIPSIAQTDSIVDSRDGQVYQTVKIGNQWWTSENLNLGTMILSDTPGYQMNNDTIVEKYCWENDCDYCDGTNGKIKKGGFYEWKEAMSFWSGQPNLPCTGVCPEGWHIPTHSEWYELINYLGGESAAAPKLLVGGSSGFEGILTGYRCTFTGGFRPSAMSNDLMGYYWSSNQIDSENTHVFQLSSSIFNVPFSFSKSLGLSVRCIKDESTTLGANFSVSETIGIDTLTVQFSDFSIGSPTSWIWDFGDDTYSNDQNPVHFYESPGVYTVQLIVSDGTNADTLTKSDFIVIEMGSFSENIKTHKEHLYQNSPNPFSDFTKIKFSIEKRSNVDITFLDYNFKVVNKLVSKEFEAGLHEIEIDATDFATGIYFYQMKTSEHSFTKKLEILK